MNNTVLHLVGANGAGKSVVPKELYDLSNDKVPIYDSEGLGINATLLRDYRVIVIGSYKTNCGGADGLSGKGGLDRINRAVRDVLAEELYNGMFVFIEGVIIGTIVNIVRVNELVRSYQSTYVLVHCNIPLEVCLSRVYSRNGGKQINEDLVGDKVRFSNRIPSKLEGTGIYYTLWDNKDVLRDNMLPSLWELIYSGSIQEL